MLVQEHVQFLIMLIHFYFLSKCLKSYFKCHCLDKLSLFFFIHIDSPKEHYERQQRQQAGHFCYCYHLVVTYNSFFQCL